MNFNKPDELLPMTVPSGLIFYLDFKFPNHYISRKDIINYIAVHIKKSFYHL